MASLIPSANASGTGSMTLAGPSTNSNQTVNIPDVTGTMMVSGNMPAFSATYSGAFTVANGTLTKAPFSNSTGGFNLGGYYDYATNYRFTPLVAGYYQVNACLNFPTIGSGYTSAIVYKNGSQTIINANTSFGNYPSPAVSGVMYLNGTTDYIEVYAYQTSGGSLSTCYAQYFNACLIRAV
jgi:hypothetical protein